MRPCHRNSTHTDHMEGSCMGTSFQFCILDFEWKGKTRSSEMNTAPDINNHMRSIDLCTPSNLVLFCFVFLFVIFFLAGIVRKSQNVVRMVLEGSQNVVRGKSEGSQRVVRM